MEVGVINIVFGFLCALHIFLLLFNNNLIIVTFVMLNFAEHLENITDGKNKGDKCDVQCQKVTLSYIWQCQ